MLALACLMPSRKNTKIRVFISVIRPFRKAHERYEKKKKFPCRQSATTE